MAGIGNSHKNDRPSQFELWQISDNVKSERKKCIFVYIEDPNM